MGHSVDGQQRDLTSTPRLVGKGPPGRLTTECFYFRRVGRPAGPTGRPSAYVGVRRTKNAETIKANKTNSCWSNEEAVCRHWCPKGDGSVWADNTGGMTVSKSTLIKTKAILHSIACLISLVSRPKKCGNKRTNEQTKYCTLSQVNTQVRPQTNKQKTPETPHSRKKHQGDPEIILEGSISQ